MRLATYPPLPLPTPACAGRPVHSRAGQPRELRPRETVHASACRDCKFKQPPKSYKRLAGRALPWWASQPAQRRLPSRWLGGRRPGSRKHTAPPLTPRHSDAASRHAGAQGNAPCRSALQLYPSRLGNGCVAGGQLCPTCICRQLDCSALSCIRRVRKKWAIHPSGCASSHGSAAQLPGACIMLRPQAS